MDNRRHGILNAPALLQSLRKSRLKSGPILIVGILILALFQIQAMTSPAKADKTTSGAPRLIKYVLHGSTPSMAWSPNSKKLVVNSAYEYFGFEHDVTRNRRKLGLYVVDVRRGKISHIISGRQAYHPFWLDDNTVGWGHSGAEDGDDGIFLHKLNARRNKVTQLDFVHFPFHTSLGNSRNPATKGKILYFDWHRVTGHTYRGDWMLADPKTHRTSRAPAGSGKHHSWIVPTHLTENQCLQKAGRVAIRVVSGKLLLTFGSTNHFMPGRLPFYSNDQCRAQGKGICSGYVRACLSPDGRYVAYFTARAPARTGHGKAGPPKVGHIPLELRVVRTSQKITPPHRGTH